MKGKEREARDPKGKAILRQAFAGGKTLTFKQEDDGTLIIQDNTKHLERLEELADEHDLEYNE